MPLPCGSTSSRERLEILDDERRVLSFRVVGGEHCLANYRSSVTTVHEAAPGHTLVGTKMESHCQEIPPRWSCLLISDPIVGKSEASLQRSRWPELHHHWYCLRTIQP